DLHSFPTRRSSDLVFWPRARENQIKWIALIFSLLTFGASLILLFSFDTTTAALQHEHLMEWLSFGNFKISYYVAVDGLSILLVLLTAFIMPLAILFSLYHVKERVRLYYAFMLLLEFAMIGVFVAQDLFLFYVSGKSAWCRCISSWASGDRKSA